MQYGTRTLCHTCARILDEQTSGGGLRAVGFFGLCAVLLVLGFKAFKAEMPLVGFALWAAGPIAWAIVESSIKRQIAKRVWQEENQPYIQPQQAFDTPAPTEAQDEDNGSAGMEALRGSFSAGDFRLGFSAIKDDESLMEWCERTAEAFPTGLDFSKKEIYDLLLSAVQFRKPRAGEPVAVWFEETIKRMREVSRSVSTNLFGPESGRRPDESNLQWLSRVGPLFLNVKDGESMDDVIDALAGIADQAPPNKGEGVMAWFERVRPLIIEYNARQDEAA
ncbi:hypothetical protein [Zoogloea sp.]|uniref:hypothetical protein n=1 Tax=Zoogloea sp. TaxID=49181 RepID=UPI0035ADF2B4